MGNYHVPFWRAVEGVTPSLTLIIGRKSNPEGFDCLKSILRDRGCLVVHPRRITPLFKRVHAESRVA